MKILVLDNYDSFTYNLVYILKQNEIDYDVIRNDKITKEEALHYDGILLSPGPGIPEEAGNMPRIIENCAGQIPILGICLGHQAIAQFLGGEIINRNDVLHGMQTPILRTQKASPIFENVPENFEAGRYHSWELNKENIPEKIECTAIDEQGSIMALQNLELNLFGLQFHPESIMTSDGKKMVDNFIEICKSTAS